MFYDGFFDFNGDGKLGPAEEFAEYEMFSDFADGDVPGSKRRKTPNVPSEQKSTTSSGDDRTVMKVVVILFIIVAILIAIPTIRDFMPRFAHDRAEKLIAQGEYTQAKEILWDIASKDENPDNFALYQLCEAHELYDAGEVDEAYYMMMVTVFRAQTEEQMAQINAFKEQLGREHNEGE